MRGKHTRSPSSRPTSKIVCPTLTCVTRATAELPSFYGVSRKKLLALASDAKQCSPVGGGIFDTGNQQAVDDENQGARWRPACASTGLIWKEPGYKVAWIERVCQYVKVLPLSSSYRISRLAHPRRTGPLCVLEHHRDYGWTGHKSSSDFSDIARPALGVFASLDRF
jgi:hypothetical protein